MMKKWLFFMVVALFAILGFGFRNGAKNLESFSDFSFENDENIVIKKSGSASADEEKKTENEGASVVETVSDDEINTAMEKLFGKGDIAGLVDAVVEKEPEEIFLLFPDPGEQISQGDKQQNIPGKIDDAVGQHIVVAAVDHHIQIGTDGQQGNEIDVALQHLPVGKTGFPSAGPEKQQPKHHTAVDQK